MGFIFPLAKYLERADGLPIDDLTAFLLFLFFNFSSRDVKLKKFLEVSLFHCFELLVTVSFYCICVPQFRCLFSVRATRPPAFLNIMDRGHEFHFSWLHYFHQTLSSSCCCVGRLRNKTRTVYCNWGLIATLRTNVLYRRSTPWQWFWSTYSTLLDAFWS